MWIQSIQQFQIFIFCTCFIVALHNRSIIPAHNGFHILVSVWQNKSDILWWSVWFVSVVNTHNVVGVCIGIIIIWYNVDLFTLIYTWCLIKAQTSFHNTPVKRKHDLHTTKCQSCFTGQTLTHSEPKYNSWQDLLWHLFLFGSNVAWILQHLLSTKVDRSKNQKKSELCVTFPTRHPAGKAVIREPYLSVHCHQVFWRSWDVGGKDGGYFCLFNLIVWRDFFFSKKQYFLYNEVIILQLWGLFWVH